MYRQIGGHYNLTGNHCSKTGESEVGQGSRRCQPVTMSTEGLKCGDCSPSFNDLSDVSRQKLHSKRLRTANVTPIYKKEKVVNPKITAQLALPVRYVK